MAISFSLDIYFGNQNYDFELMKDQIESMLTPYKEIDFHSLNHKFITAEGRVPDQLSIHPKNVSIALSFDDSSKKQHIIDDEQAFELSLHMLNFIKDLPHYEIACVGWEICYLDSFIDYDQKGNITDVNAGANDGVVFHKKFLPYIKNQSEYEEFDQDHVWIPQVDSIGNREFFDDTDDEE